MPFYLDFEGEAQKRSYENNCGKHSETLKGGSYRDRSDNVRRYEELKTKQDTAPRSARKPL